MPWAQADMNPLEEIPPSGQKNDLKIFKLYPMFHESII
jgi:hypothetical protein